ncbi:MAG: hypothetical protein IPL28_14060 [Chloroflexi bacterium]|nr:hypothetical protein [Chloroflexota bacterium]
MRTDLHNGSWPLVEQVIKLGRKRGGFGGERGGVGTAAFSAVGKALALGMGSGEAVGSAVPQPTNPSRDKPMRRVVNNFIRFVSPK